MSGKKRARRRRCAWNDPSRPDRPDGAEFLCGRNEAGFNICRCWDRSYVAQVDISRFREVSGEEVERLRSAGRLWE